MVVHPLSISLAPNHTTTFSRHLVVHVGQICNLTTSTNSPFVLRSVYFLSIVICTKGTNVYMYRLGVCMCHAMLYLMNLSSCLPVIRNNLPVQNPFLSPPYFHGSRSQQTPPHLQLQIIILESTIVQFKLSMNTMRMRLDYIPN